MLWITFANIRDCICVVTMQCWPCSLLSKKIPKSGRWDWSSCSAVQPDITNWWKIAQFQQNAYSEQNCFMSKMILGREKYKINVQLELCFGYWCRLASKKLKGNCGKSVTAIQPCRMSCPEELVTQGEHQMWYCLHRDIPFASFPFPFCHWSYFKKPQSLFFN